MMYLVKEIFYSIQGEGFHSGRPAVFCRFAGCNLWSGKEEDRKNAVCSFCDTDFVGTDGPNGGRYATADHLSQTIASLWPKNAPGLFVVCTGGEPLLQLDGPLIDALHRHGFVLALETNGTLHVPKGIDWICVSPKAGADLVQVSGDELKLVYPQPGIEPEQYARLDFRHFILQPLGGSEDVDAVRRTLAYVLAYPHWRIGLQLHKILGVR